VSIVFTAPPTCADFMLSSAFFRVLMGPVGSGKTTTCMMEIFRRAVEQRKGPDGMRRTRWAVVRTTLSQLRMTVLLDMLSWFRRVASYKVSEQLITIAFNDVHCDIYLIPLEDEEDQKRLLSMQLTGCWINEAIEMSVDLVSAIAGRCGRFPSKAEGGPTFFGIIADTNTPVQGSDWHRMFDEDMPADWALFHQPSGLSPQAENVENLPERYYERLAANPNKAWVDRYVRSQYGDDPSGTAVYRESFKRSFHVKRGLLPVQGQILLIGQDFGRSPCSLICQPDFLGRLIVLEEILAEDIGLETHVNRSLKPRLYADRYAGLRFAAVGDPAGVAKGSMLEEDHFDVLRRLGIPAFPAPTNNIDSRISAVEAVLFQQRDGGGALLIDEERCPALTRAMGGAYRYAKGKDGETKPLPEKKHPQSDVCDCLQYVALTVNSGMIQMIAKRIRPRPARRPPAPVSAGGWT
jgi:hypothetical protein